MNEIIQQNINTKQYWEHRFKNGSWNKSGQRQTREYALANVKNINLSSNFTGSILDFGCAQGDAIPIYKVAFPKANISGIDISESAIATCQHRFGDIADFISGDFTNISEKDVIIASHIMEHLSNDRNIVRDLLTKCKNLYVFVPFKENPLYHEHVNYYDEDYYCNFDVDLIKIFVVSYRIKNSIRQIIKNGLLGNFIFYHYFSKEIMSPLRKVGGTD